MAYQINKTDGTIVATVADGQVDQLSTDLTLIGKNYSGFGEALNENFIKLLENFASTARPTHPIRGQLWFDVQELKLKIYSGTQFVPVGSATIANVQPATLGVGDLWFNNVDAQLYFFDGTAPILLGPSYSASQGLSGLKVDSILDTLNQTRVVTYMYTNGILLGIFSKDSFTPKNAIIGFTGSIGPGFNAGNLAGLKFNVTATNAEQLGGVASSAYVRKDTSNTMAGQLNITTDLGLVIGSAGQANLKVNSGNVTLSNASTDNDLILNVRKGIDQEDAIKIQASTRSIDLYSGFRESFVNVGGDLVIEGNLTVQGSTVTINSTSLSIEDKNIELANSDNPSDEFADGGGIILNAATDKTFIYKKFADEDPIRSSEAWNSSEHINLAPGKEFKIGGVTVINGNSLGLGITSIPGVSSFGAQTVINIGPGAPPVPQMRLENNRISTITGNLDLEISPDGTGNVALIGSPKIKGLTTSDEVSPSLENLATADLTEATSKKYVTNLVRSRNLVFSMDLSDGKPNSYIVNNILNSLAPPAYYEIGTVAKILCTLLNNSTTQLDINPLVSESRSSFVYDLTPLYAPAVTDVSIAIATVSAPSITTTRIIKSFLLTPGGWEWDDDEILPA